jgi:radical SAM superfamily enzyme
MHMGRTTGALNKKPLNHSDLLDLSIEDRLDFVANLIVDQLVELQRNDYKLLKELGIESDVERITG